MSKFYRTTFSIDVLSESPISSDCSLDEIHHMITDGPCVGGELKVSRRELTPREVADALIEFGSTPDFFMLNDDEDYL